MYIDTTGQVIDPNIVSGADFDNRAFNYGGNYMDYANVSPELEAELLEIHEMIAEDEAEVPIFKAELEAVKERQVVNRDEMTRLGQKYEDLRKQKSHYETIATISEEGAREYFEWKANFDVAGKLKDKNRGEYMFLNGEVSRLETAINSREKGSIFGLKQEFKAKAGFDYTPPPEVVEEVLPVIGGSEMDMEMIKENAFNKSNNFIKGISEKIGTSEANTKMLLIGVAVLGGILILKK